jgi:hypothetical protein
MIDYFTISLEHLTHLKRTMLIKYRPPNSNALFNVSELVDLLSNLHKKERVLNFGS